MAYAAQSNTFSIHAWLLFIASVVWTMAYDTLYAMVDREDDIKIGVKSTAIMFGEADRLITGLMQLSFIIMLAVIGERLAFGVFYYFGISMAAALCVYQQWLIRSREPEKCFAAFLNNNYVGMAVFFGIFSQYQWG
jgi:4-hydroxybenzoate polyprenyltransferase